MISEKDSQSPRSYRLTSNPIEHRASGKIPGGKGPADRNPTRPQADVPLRYLRSRLARVRELPNGFDFFFTGDPILLHENVHEFISRESCSIPILNFDRTILEDTLLLRITGPVDKKKLIRDYF